MPNLICICWLAVVHHLMVNYYTYFSFSKLLPFMRQLIGRDLYEIWIEFDSPSLEDPESEREEDPVSESAELSTDRNALLRNLCPKRVLLPRPLNNPRFGWIDVSLPSSSGAVSSDDGLRRPHSTILMYKIYKYPKHNVFIFLCSACVHHLIHNMIINCLTTDNFSDLTICNSHRDLIKCQLACETKNMLHLLGDWNHYKQCMELHFSAKCEVSLTRNKVTWYILGRKVCCTIGVVFEEEKTFWIVV